MADIVSVDQVIGRDLYAKKNLATRNYPQDNAAILKQIPRGERVGKVNSWVYGKDGNGNNTNQIWWMIDKDTLKPYYSYIKHDPDAFDWKAIQQQGGKTEQEVQQEKDDANKSVWEKFQETLAKDGKKVAIGLGIFGGLYLGIKLYKEYKE